MARLKGTISGSLERASSNTCTWTLAALPIPLKAYKQSVHTHTQHIGMGKMLAMLLYIQKKLLPRPYPTTVEPLVLVHQSSHRERLVLPRKFVLSQFTSVNTSAGHLIKLERLSILGPGDVGRRTALYATTQAHRSTDTANHLVGSIRLDANRVWGGSE